MIRGGAPEAQVLVSCGRNHDLRLALKRRYGRDPQVRVLGFTRRIPDCFAAADLLVGKPGGITATEAAACGLPLLIVDPLPGQERKNCAYLTEAGAAIEIASPARLAEALKSILRSPERMAQMRSSARRAARLDSAELACQELLDLLKRAPVLARAA